MAPHTINTTVADIQLGKIICCTPANSSSLITSATNNNARVQMSTASWTTCSICPPFSCTTPCRRRLHWLILPSMNLCDSARHSSGSPASIVPRSQTFYHGTRAPTGPPKWHNPLGLSPGCWVATRNALITMSSRVILPIKMHKRGYYSTMLFFYKNR